MSNLDMSEAIRMLAGDRGISVDSLLQVLVEALATAYKKRPNAAEEVIVGINPENMDITFTAFDVDDDGNWNEIKAFPFNNGATGFPALSADGLTLYMAAIRTGVQVKTALSTCSD